MERILRLARVERGEIGLVRSLFSLHFLVICAFIIAKTARDGLYLSELSARTLPYVYLGLAVWTAVAISLFGRYTRHIQAHRALAHGLWGTAASLVLFSIWFRIRPGAPAVVFYLWIGAYGLLLVSQFWILAAERINPRQAKRLFGIIGAGGILGGIVGGIAASQIAKVAYPERLLLVAAGLHLIATAVAARSAPRDEERAPSAPESADEGDLGLKGILGKPYVRLVAAVVFVGAITTAVVDYEFKFLLQRHLGGPAGGDAGLSPEKAAWLTVVLGYFYGAQNLIALIVQLGLTGYLLSRVGARSSSMLLPGGLLIGSAATVALPQFPLVACTWLYETVAGNSIVRSAREFLYFPLPGGVRDQTKRFMEVVVNRSAEGAAGIIILVINTLLGGSIVQLSVLVGVLSICALALERLLSRSYASELSYSLRWMLEKKAKPEVSYKEARLIDELHGLLEAQYERQVLYAMQTLREINPAGLKDKLPGLIKHSSSQVRARALELAVEFNVVADVKSVEPLLEDPDGNVRLHAAYFYCTCTPGDPHASMAQLLRSESGRIRSGAFQCVAAHSPPEEDDKVDAIAREFLDRGKLSDRIAVATAAGGRKPPAKLHGHLKRLIQDSDPKVRRAAIRSAPRTGRRDLIPPLLRMIGDRELSEDVVTALAQYGDRVVGTLGDFLADPDVAVGVKRTLPRVLSLIGSQNAVNALFRVPLDEDPTFAEQVLRALGRIRRDNPGVLIPEHEIMERIHWEVKSYLRLLLQRDAIGRQGGDDSIDLLARVLAERSTQARRRLFRVLVLVYPRRDTRLAYRGVVSKNARLHAQAVEYLESVLSAQHRQLILPVIEPGSWQDRLKVAAHRLGGSGLTLEQTLRQIIKVPDPWLKACALYAIGRSGKSSLKDLVSQCSGSQDALVKEMVDWAGARMDEVRKEE